MTTLAYTPFIDPLDLHDIWFVLIVPLAFGIALAYKAVRCGQAKRYPRQVLMMTVQIVVGIALLGVASYIVLDKILPMIAPMPGG